MTWSDGHGSIYPFDRLRRDCPCGACAPLETLAPPMGWPRDITRGDGVLQVTWSDGHRSLYPYGDLRGLCRCAGCTGGH